MALTVNDATGDRYLIIRELVRDLDRDGGWRSCSGSEGLDRVIPGKPDPYVSFYAHAGGRFFAGGRVQSASTGVARVRLVWQDGYALEDEVHNGVVLFFGARDSLDRATAEFLDPAGRVLGAHVTLIDEGPRLPGSPPQIGAAATELGGHSTRKPRFSAWAG